MPRRQRFQHRKKKERDRRVKRLSTKSPVISETSHAESESDLTSTISSSIEREQQSPMTEYQSLPTTSAAQMLNPERTPECVSSPLCQLHSTLTLPNSFWSDQSPENLETIMLCRISRKTQPLTVTHSLTINADLSWTLFVNQHKVDTDTCIALKSFAGPLNDDKLSQLLVAIDKLLVCAGQPDDHFVRMILAKKGKILSSNGKVAAYVDNERVELNGELYPQTVRTSECEIIGHSVKCSSCNQYRATLRSMYHRWNKRKSHGRGQSSTTESSSEASKFTNERYLNTPEKLAKIDDLRKRAHNAEQTVTKLREKIRKLTEDQGEVLDQTFQSCKKILIILRRHILKAVLLGCFGRNS